MGCLKGVKYMNWILILSGGVVFVVIVLCGGVVIMVNVMIVIFIS